MLAKRSAALVVAVTLVLGAFWLRSRRDDSDPAAPPTTTTGSDAGALLCIPELAASCRQVAAAHGLDLTVEPAGTTLERLAADDHPPGVAWATLAPFPALVDDLRARAGRAPLFATPATPLASSPLVLVGRADQMAVLSAHCGDRVAWRCLGEVAGRPWTDIGGQAAWQAVKPAHESPDVSAVGLLTFATAVGDYFGTTDVSTTELRQDAFADWVRRLERSVPSFGSAQETPFERFLLIPEVNVVGTTQAEVDQVSGSRRSDLQVSYPGAMAQADAVLAVAGGTGAAPTFAPDLGSALQGDHWSAPGPSSPPAPGTLLALRSLWRDVVR